MPSRPSLRAFLLVAASLLLGALLGPARADDDSAPASPAPTPLEPAVVLTTKLGGIWYPADAEALLRQIDGLLARAPRRDDPEVRAIVLPHAAYKWSGATAAEALARIRGRHFARVIVLGPDHHGWLENVASVPHATHYRTPLGLIPLDRKVLDALERHPEFVNAPRIHEAEHSVQIELPLLQRAIGDFVLVPVVVGKLDPGVAARMAAVLSAFVDADTLVVASSDFTHYGTRFSFLPFTDHVLSRIRTLDLGAWDRLERADADGFRRYLEDTGDNICGRYALEVLMRMLPPDLGAEAAVRCGYDTSGHIGGTTDESVSYLSAAYRVDWHAREEPAVEDVALGPDDRRALLKLARQAIVYAIENMPPPRPQELGVRLTPALERPSGAFVTLEEGGHLRGCIGELHPMRPLWRAVMVTAASAAVNDHRFAPVDADEVPSLQIEVSVLTPPKEIASYEEIQLGKHGIVLEKRGHLATFLPQVATEQGWNLEQTLTHLAKKAGLPPDAWRKDAHFEVFETEVFAE